MSCERFVWNHPADATILFLSCLSNDKPKLCLDQHVVNIHEELIARCKAGDREAHYKLYKLYSRAMYNVGFRITGREEDAEDALQEAFISAFRNLSSYRGDAAFGAWLKRIVVNKAINVLKKRKLELISEDENWDVSEPEPAAEYKEGLSIERVKKAIERLPEGYRAVLSLYLIEGYDHDEIASILHISVSTSKSQLNRAKNKLRELLTERV
jgi:RNA polymerase sigma factor (sigma-70 family)